MSARSSLRSSLQTLLPALFVAIAGCVNDGEAPARSPSHPHDPVEIPNSMRIAMTDTVSWKIVELGDMNVLLEEAQGAAAGGHLIRVERQDGAYGDRLAVLRFGDSLYNLNTFLPYDSLEGQVYRRAIGESVMCKDGLCWGAPRWEILLFFQGSIVRVSYGQRTPRGDLQGLKLLRSLRLADSPLSTPSGIRLLDLQLYNADRNTQCQIPQDTLDQFYEWISASFLPEGVSVSGMQAAAAAQDVEDCESAGLLWIQENICKRRFYMTNPMTGPGFFNRCPLSAEAR